MKQRLSYGLVIVATVAATAVWLAPPDVRAQITNLPTGAATSALQTTLNSLVTTLNGYVDGLETLIGTTNSTLTTVDGRVDGLEGQVGATNESAAASDTATSGLNGLLKRIAQNLTTVAGRFMSAAALADNTANPTTTGVAAFMMCFDGSTWDRCSGSAADTELPAAAALADNTANPTVPGVAAYFMCYDGSTWDRCRTSTDATFGTTTYTETSSTGPIVGGVRNDTPDSLANTTNEITPFGFTAAGAVWASDIDPCSYKAKSTYVVNVSSATTTEIANAVASEFFYICSINLVAAAAQTVAIVEDDTDGVGSPTAGLNGGTSAATGWSFAANSGIVLGNGSATVMKTGTANRYLGFITGQAAQLSGTIVYVSAP